jgi:hypothetical protein
MKTRGERNVDLLLRAYPRQVNTDELRSCLIREMPTNRMWPLFSEIKALVTEALRARGRGSATSQMQTWKVTAADSLAWTVGLGVGIELRFGLAVSPAIRWVSFVSSVSFVSFVLIIFAFLLGLRRSKMFVSSIAVLAIGWAAHDSVRGGFGGGGVGGVGRLVQVGYVAACFLIVFGAISSRRLGREFGLVLMGLLALGVLAIRVATPYVGVRTISGATAVGMAGGFVIVMYTGGFFAIGLRLARDHIRPSGGRWLLAAPLVGFALGKGGFPEFLYALVVLAALMLVTVNPRLVLTLGAAPWGLAILPAIVIELLSTSFTPRANSGVLYVIAFGIASAFLCVRGVRRIHAMP